MHGTPATITPAVLKLCEELVPGQRPLYLDVEPADGAQLNSCFPNVAAHIATHGGTVQHGWQVWEMPGLIMEAEFHGVWVDPSGAFRDITPKKDGDARILFLPDPVRVFDGRQVNNVRRPLGKHPAIRKMIAEYDRQFEILNRGERLRMQGEVTLTAEEADEYQSSQRAAAEAMAEALGPAGLKKQWQAMGLIPPSKSQGGVRVQPAAKPQRSRNAPCHCGSGQKYKKCHGAPVQP